MFSSVKYLNQFYFSFAVRTFKTGIVVQFLWLRYNKNGIVHENSDKLKLKNEKSKKEKHKKSFV